MSRRVLLLLAALAACAGSAAQESADLRIEEVGRFNFVGGDDPTPRLVAAEISGFVWLEGDRYVAVGDDTAALFFLRLAVDLASGRVTAAAFEPAVPLAGAGAALEDREAVAPAPDGVWIASEGGPSGRRVWLALHGLDGATLKVLDPATLDPFGDARPNLGFEALTRAPDGGYWAANEEALPGDGPTAAPGHGSVVRLVRFDPAMRPRAQYAYVTEPVEGAIRVPPQAVGHELSGLVELVALPDGELLALERALDGGETGMAGFRLRIFHVGIEGATDVSGTTALEGGRWVPVSKERLLELRPGLLVSNFEAMALGPRLENGDRSLLLMADNGGGTNQSVYALRLRRTGASAGR